MASRAKHSERSHRGHREKYRAFSGFYYHAPKGFRRHEFLNSPLLRKLFGWINVAK